MSSSIIQTEFLIQIRINSKSKSHLIELVVNKKDEKQALFLYESILTINGVSEIATWTTNDVQLLKAHFTKYLQKLISQYNLETDQIEILEDSHSLLELVSAYCQHCGKKLYETYGQAYGVIKKCPSCGKLSFYRDQK